jgi:hypothetical protein
MSRKRRSNERAYEREVIVYSSSQPTPATLTFSTMKAIASAVKPANRSEPRVRLSRYERDQVRKFKVWPLIGDTKAVAVRPRMSEREAAEATKLLYGVRKAA